MGKRTIHEKLQGLADAWYGNHIGDVAAEALTFIKELEAEKEEWEQAAYDQVNKLNQKTEELKAKLARVEDGCHKWNGLVNTDQERAILRTFWKLLNQQEQSGE